MRRTLALRLLWLASPALVACGGTSSSPAETLSDASIDAPEGSDAAIETGSDAPPAKPASDPGKIQCGASTCDAPAQFCCYSSIAPGGAADHCETSGPACQAPSIDCDETSDCAPNALCCTGVAVLPLDAGVSGFEATSCVALNAPNSCKPQSGVGNSSVQVCKLDSECLDGKECVAQLCYGRVLMTCGPDAQCK